MDLVIMAAGLGSRFGGDKQIEPVDDDGNFILDYSVHDAVKAGFDRIILIIRREHKEVFDKIIGSRLSKVVKVEYAFQEMEDVPRGTKIPPEREKPWGTAHALYSARDIVSNRFAVVNADDFYGFESYKIIADALKTSRDNEFFCAGYVLKETLSQEGGVKRGILEVENGFVKRIIESNIETRNGDIYASPLGKNQFVKVDPNTLVSLTTFGFSKKIMDGIKEEGLKFFSQSEEVLRTAEFLLPPLVGDMVGKISLKVIKTPSKWFGITYKNDLEAFKKTLAGLRKEGKYPKHLY